MLWRKRQAKRNILVLGMYRIVVIYNDYTCTAVFYFSYEIGLLQ